MMQAPQHHHVYQKDRLGLPETPVAAGDIELQVLVGSGLFQPLIKSLPAQCGSIHLHSRGLLLWQENHQYIVGSAK